MLRETIRIVTRADAVFYVPVFYGPRTGRYFVNENDVTDTMVKVVLSGIGKVANLYILGETLDSSEAILYENSDYIDYYRRKAEAEEAGPEAVEYFEYWREGGGPRNPS